jgi:hypothetical protein
MTRYDLEETIEVLQDLEPAYNSDDVDGINNAIMNLEMSVSNLHCIDEIEEIDG